MTLSCHCETGSTTTSRDLTGCHESVTPPLQVSITPCQMHVGSHFAEVLDALAISSIGPSQRHFPDAVTLSCH